MSRISPAALVAVLLAVAGPGEASARALGTETSRVENGSFSDRWVLTLAEQTDAPAPVGSVRILKRGTRVVLANLQRPGEAYALGPREVVDVEIVPGSNRISLALKLSKGRAGSAQAVCCRLQQSPLAPVPSIEVDPGDADVQMNPVFFGYPESGPWITIE